MSCCAAHRQTWLCKTLDLREQRTESPAENATPCYARPLVLLCRLKYTALKVIPFWRTHINILAEIFIVVFTDYLLLQGSPPSRGDAKPVCACQIAMFFPLSFPESSVGLGIFKLCFCPTCRVAAGDVHPGEAAVPRGGHFSAFSWLLWKQRMLKKLALLGVSDDLCTTDSELKAPVLLFFFWKEGKLGFLKEPAHFIFVIATEVGWGALALSFQFAAWRGQGQDPLIPVVFAAPPSARAPIAASSSRLLYSKNPCRLSLTYFNRPKQLKHSSKMIFSMHFKP